MTAQDIFIIHKQIFPKSCPSSVMELVLKLHGKMKPDCFDIQNLYGDYNVGFSKKFELDNRGLNTKEQSLPPKDALLIIEQESKDGRFPLVSMPTETRKGLFLQYERVAEDSCHIFIPILANGKLTLVCHAHQAQFPFVFGDIDVTVREILRLLPTYQMNFLTYVI